MLTRLLSLRTEAEYLNIFFPSDRIAKIRSIRKFSSRNEKSREKRIEIITNER